MAETKEVKPLEVKPPEVKPPEVKKVVEEPQQYMCTRDCYMKHETEKPMRYKQGHVATFTKAPAFHFTAVGKVNIDFESSPPDVLKASTSWTVTDLVAYAKKEYRIVIDSRLTKDQIVDKFIDARFRNIGTKPYVG